MNIDGTHYKFYWHHLTGEHTTQDASKSQDVHSKLPVGQQALHEVFKKAQHHRHIVIRLLPRLWLQPDNVVHEMGSSYVLI